MPKREERMLKINDAARALNIEEHTMRRMLREGRIAGAFKTGKSRTNPWRIPQSALDRFIKERQKERGQANE